MPQLPPFDYTPMPYDGPSPEEILALRKQFVNPAIFHYYKKPITIVEGKAQYLFDETGRRYLDGFGGIVTVSVGHCHPEVLAAATLQNETISHTTTIYLNPQIALYATGTRRKDARRSQGLLFRQLRLRGERSRRADGPRLHAELRRHRPAQRLPRRQPELDGAHLAPHLEVQRPAFPRRPPRDDAGQLPRPLRHGRSGRRKKIRRRHRRNRALRHAGKNRRLHRRVHPGRRRQRGFPRRLSEGSLRPSPRLRRALHRG